MDHRFFPSNAEYGTQERHPIPDYGHSQAYDNPAYQNAFNMPNAYDLNQAYNGKQGKPRNPSKTHWTPETKPMYQYDASDTTSEAKNSKQSHCPKVIIGVVVILMIMLIVAIGLALGFGLSEENDSRPSSRFESEDLSREPDFTGTVIVEDLLWDPRMVDTDSDIFKTTASDVENSLDTYYKNTSLSEIYDYAVVTGLRQGSVWSNFRLYLKSLSENTPSALRMIYDSIRAGQGQQKLADLLEQGQEAIAEEEEEEPPRTRRSVVKRFQTTSLRELQPEEMLTTETPQASGIVGTTTANNGAVGAATNESLAMGSITSGGTVGATTTAGRGTVGTTTRSGTVVGTTTTSKSGTMGTTTTSGGGIGTTTPSTGTMGTTTTSKIGTVGTTTTGGGGVQTTTASIGTMGTTTIRSGTVGTTTRGETVGTTTGGGMLGTTRSSGNLKTSGSSGTVGTTTSSGTMKPTTRMETTLETTPSSDTMRTTTSSGTEGATASETMRTTTNSFVTVHTMTSRGTAGTTTTSSGTVGTTTTTTTNSGTVRTTTSITTGGSTTSSETIETSDSGTVGATVSSGTMEEMTISPDGIWETTTTVEISETTSVAGENMKAVQDLTAKLSQGQLWLWYKNNWKSICVYEFPQDAAVVVCHQMGYKYGFFYEGVEMDGALQFDSLRCGDLNTTKHLSQCSTKLSGSGSSCVVTNINCFNSTQPSLTLSGQPDAVYGYLTVKWDDQEGLLCSTLYYNHFDYIASSLCYDIYPTSWGGINLDSTFNISLPVQADIWQVVAYCTSLPRTAPFSDCVKYGWQFLHYGDYSNSALYVTSPPPYAPPPTTTTARPEYALHSSRLPLDQCIMKLYCYLPTVVFPQGPDYFGVVVTKPNSEYLCRDTFKDSEAAVMCRALGFSSGTSLRFNPIPGHWHDYQFQRGPQDFLCSGDEQTIDQCAIVKTIRSCSGPAVVRCKDGSEPVVQDTKWKVKLASDGRTVLVNYQGLWGTICNTLPEAQWTAREATMVCRRLGFTNGVPRFKYASVMHPPPHVIRNMTCPETARELEECLYAVVDSDVCEDKHPAEVYCYNLGDMAQMELVTGPEHNSGLVKVTMDGQEGYLCTYDPPNFSPDFLPDVLCRQFGFYSGEYDFDPLMQDPDLPNIWQADFNGDCNGKDSLLDICRSSTWVKHSTDLLDQTEKSRICNWGYVHLYCYGKAKLSGAPRQSSGNLVAVNPDKYVDVIPCLTNLTQPVADVACREILGIPEGKAKILASGTYPWAGAYNASFNCAADAMSLSECMTVYTYNGQCPRSTLACYDGRVPLPAPSTVPEWKLDGPLVLVKAQGLWSQVCADTWTEVEAAILCKTLNSSYTLGYARSYRRSYILPLWLTSVKCDSTAENINDCMTETIEDHDGYCNCECPRTGYESVAETYCYQGESDIPHLELVDKEEGTFYDTGHLAVNISGQAGYYCFDGYSPDPDKLCRVMGYFGGQTVEISWTGQDVKRFKYNTAWKGRLDCDWKNSTCHLAGNLVEVEDSGSSSWDEKSGLCEETPKSLVCYKWKVRLPSPRTREGLFLIQDSNGWSAICGMKFRLTNYADKFCREAGYTSGIGDVKYFGDYDVKYYSMSCPSKDSNFEDCTYTKGGCENAGYVVCDPPGTGNYGYLYELYGDYYDYY